MPYIAKGDREALDPLILQFDVHAMTKGDVNYVISRLVTRWVETREPLGYNTLSLGHNVLQDAAAEYYRRVMAPYEDKKAKDNGDVYGSLTGVK